MSKGIKTGKSARPAAPHTAAVPAIDLPREVEAHLNRIRALIVAGNVHKAGKALHLYHDRFPGFWSDIAEIHEAEAQILKMKIAITRKQHS